MPEKQNFVFFSKKRWNLLKLLTAIFLVFFGILSFTIFQSYSRSPFGTAFSEAKNQKIIDQISTRIPDKIKIEGNGPLLTLGEKNGQYYLERSYPLVKEKTAFLTFDDGPDPIYTQKILEILRKEKIKATFFLVGNNIYKYPSIVKQIVREGHLIGAHTFSHYPENFDLYKEPDLLVKEFELTRILIEENAGYETKVFRLPYLGAEQNISMNNLVLSVEATQRGYKIIDVDVDPLDWKAKDSETIVNDVKSAPTQNAPVIMLHDSGGDRDSTVEALSEIIAFYKNNGYRFGTVSDLLPGEQITFQIKDKEFLTNKVIYLVYDFFRSIPLASTRILLLGLVLFGIHTILVTTLAFLHKLQEKRVRRPTKSYKPKVTVVIPVYNEEKVIEKTVLSVLDSNYPDYEVIVVDDGSTDTSSEILQKLEKVYRDKLKVLYQENQGKFAALNNGFGASKGEIIVAIDADTQILANTVSALARHFKDPRVGAVAGNIKVGNRINWLTTLQELDYRMALNLERRAFSLINAVYVIPGAVGGWRKEALEKAGGFTNNTLTEDAEAGMRIRRLGYRINYEGKAIAYTEVPVDLTSLIRQRFRWTFGSLQTLWMHKDVLFRPQYGFFSLVVLPYTVFVQIPSMVLAPIIEFSAIPVAIFISTKIILVSLFGLLLARLLLFIIASKLDGEDTKLSAFVLPYRFFYQILWYFVLDYSILVALRGSFIAWQKMNHLGTMGLDSVQTDYSYSVGSDITPSKAEKS